MALTVEIQPRDGKWVKLGSGHRYGVVPNSIEYDSNVDEYGSLSANFKLNLNPRFPHYDLEHFTPVVIKDGNKDVWSGRIIATPTQYGETGVVNIECQGWGQHLKDDCINKVWLKTNINDWVETKTQEEVNLTRVNHGTNITHGTGGRVVGSVPEGGKLQPSTIVASWTLDLGPDNIAKAGYITYESSNNWGANATLLLFTSPLPDPYTAPAGYADFHRSTSPGAGPTQIGSTVSGGQRYVHALLFWGGVEVTPAADVWIAFSEPIISTSASYVSAGASDLHASTIITDVLDRACPLISADRSKIEATTYDIPEFPSEFGFKYANELINGCNAYHGYLFLLSPNPVPIPSFGPLPTDPTFVVGQQDKYAFENPSTNDGRGVYSRVITEFNDVWAKKSYGQSGGLEDTTNITLANPSFEVDTTGWSVSGGSMVRSTAQFYSGIASLEVTPSSVAQVQAVAAGQVKKGYRYRISFAYRPTNAVHTAAAISPTIDGSTNGQTQVAGNNSVIPGFEWQLSRGDYILNTWNVLWGDFIADRTGTLTVNLLFGGVAALYVDQVLIGGSEDLNTVLFRGFQRTALRPMASRSTSAVANTVADLYLSSMNYPPLKGTLAIKGKVRLKDGSTINASELPSHVGKAIVIEDLKDPLTGSTGRQGILKTAKYVEVDDVATATIDDPKSFIENLLTRFGK